MNKSAVFMALLVSAIGTTGNVLAATVDSWGARIFLEFSGATAAGGGSGFEAIDGQAAGGAVTGNVVLEADDGLPTIKVLATGAPSGDASAFGSGLQKYQFTGAQTTDVTVSGNADGVVTGDTFVRATLWLFTADDLGISEQELANFFSDGSIKGVFNEGIFPESDGDTASQDDGGPNPFNLPLSVTLAIDPGETFWVYADFSVFADGLGALADGTTTAIFDFDTTDYTILGATAVPLPGALVLLISGVGVAATRRRATSA